MPKWSKANLQAALREIESGEATSINSAAKKYGILKSTLYDHAKKKVTRAGAGRPTVLSEKEEEEVVYCRLVLQEIGFGLNKDTIAAVVVDYLQHNRREYPFSEGQPGWYWWQGFLKRWPKLHPRKCQHLSVKRATAANTTTMNDFLQ